MGTFFLRNSLQRDVVQFYELYAIIQTSVLALHQVISKFSWVYGWPARYRSHVQSQGQSPSWIFYASQYMVRERAVGGPQWVSQSACVRESVSKHMAAIGK